MFASGSANTVTASYSLTDSPAAVGCSRLLGRDVSGLFALGASSIFR